MQTCKIPNTKEIGELTCAVYATTEPVIVSCNDEKRFIALQPRAFEHLLFGSAILDCIDRSSLHL